jgi:hypothetical protein
VATAPQRAQPATMSVSIDIVAPRLKISNSKAQPQLQAVTVHEFIEMQPALHAQLALAARTLTLTFIP